MELSKRQLTESHKRQNIILDLLHENNATRSIQISYEKKRILIDNYYILGYFTNYKNLKQLQDNTIKAIKTTLKTLDNLDLCQSMNDIKRSI